MLVAFPDHFIIVFLFNVEYSYFVRLFFVSILCFDQWPLLTFHTCREILDYQSCSLLELSGQPLNDNFLHRTISDRNGIEKDCPS